VICISYVDDLIFWAHNEKDIHHIAMKLREVGVNLEQETDAAGLLGIRMEHDPDTGLLEMNQEGLTLCIIEAMGLDVGTVTPKWMPAEAAPWSRMQREIRQLVHLATAVLLECCCISLVTLALTLHVQSIVQLGTCSVLRNHTRKH
jgi:hypothetical protein